MQITVKSTEVLKTGSNDYGDWKLVKIVTDEDVEYTTLAKEADIIASGVTINISNMDEKEYNGVVQKSFKKFEFVHGAANPDDTEIPQQDEVDKALKEATEELKKPDPRGDPKNRSYALSYAKDWCGLKLQAGVDLKTADVITVAKEFAKYLDNG